MSITKIHIALVSGVFFGAILTAVMAIFVVVWPGEKTCVDQYDPYKSGQCRLSVFEDQYVVFRDDIAPYTLCKCAVNRDNDVTTACCCMPD